MATTQNFTLKFQADVSQAKKAVQDLNNSLKAVTNANFSNSGISLELEKASIAAQELRTHLMTATNASTGKLNLNDFNKSITASKTNLSSLLQNLANGGQAGQQAFMSFATTVAQSEVPLRKVNARLASIGTTIKNTIKWQLSSSLINSFVRGISSAIGYVKDLNSSLNDIRIVTGKSVEEMARFAEQANRAAKELSTTTKAYTDASLIYYQQGESAEMAAKKAAITIKAANASFGSSAKEMSEYLTAVWNSYQVGADELERYVDIMASLGANTATSMEEIATSMQKVAATANTVGVSMEQISSIISTVSSVTRESAESIGTSYKTILARIGDLKLGETLEDGVGLGQVSSELDKIGVKILDASGEMRDMGAIIEDIGSKWQNMGRAQQTALAQIVAGKRQYTQFMALFENWDKYQKNMDIASNSSGSLQNMQDTFTESWEGASKRLRASLENIWQDLLNDEGMIKITNTITKIVDGIGGFIDALGGAKGTLQAFGAMALLVFQKQITNSVIAATASMKNFFTQKNEASQYINNLQHIKSVMSDLRTTSDSTGDSIKIDNAVRLIELKETLAQKESKLNDMQKQRAQAVISSFSEEMNIVDQLGVKYDELSAKAKQKATEAKTNALAQAGQANTLANDKLLFQQRLNNFTDSSAPESMKALYTPWMEHFIMGKQGVNSMSGIMGLGQKMGEDLGALDNAIQRIQQLKSESQTTGQSMSSEFSAAFKSLETAAGSAAPKVRTQIEELKAGIHTMSPDEISQKFTNLVNSIMRIQYGVPSIDMMVERLRAMGIITDENEQDFREIASASIEAGQALDRAGHAADNLGKRMKKANTDMQNTKTGWNTVLNGVQTAAAAAMSFSAALTAASNVAKNWDDGNLTSKISGIASAFSSVAMLAGSGAKIGGPWGAVIGAGVGILASIGGAVAGYQEAKEEKRVENLNKHNESRKKTIDTITEENSEIKKLLTNYNSLNTEYINTGEVTSELITATQQLAEAYELADSAIISTKEDLENLQDKITLATLTNLLETEQEYQKQIDSAFLEISTGESARDGNTKLKALSSSYSRIQYTEEDMQAFHDASMLTAAEERFWNEIKTAGGSALYKGEGDLSHMQSEMVKITEPLTNWTQATINDMVSYFKQDVLQSFEEAGINLQTLIDNGMFYMDQNQNQLYGKDVDSAGNTSFYRIGTGGEGISLVDDLMYYNTDVPAVQQRVYTLDTYSYIWEPEVKEKEADSLDIDKVGRKKNENGTKTQATNLNASLMGLFDYFGIQDGVPLDNIYTVLYQFFTDTAWSSEIIDHVGETAYNQFVEDLFNAIYAGAELSVEDIQSTLSNFNLNEMRVDSKNKELDFSLLSTLAETQYKTAQEIINQNWNVAFGEAEDFALDSFLQVNGESLFTGAGTLIWDDLSGGQQLLDQYKKISEASANIEQKKAALAKWRADQGFEEGTPEFEAVEQMTAELDKIDAVYQQIIGEGTTTHATFEPLVKAERAIEETGIARQLIQDIQNDSVSDYEALTTAITTFDSDYSKFLDESQYSTPEKLAQARKEFIQALVKSYGSDLEVMSTLYFSVEEALKQAGSDASVESYLQALLNMGITSVDQITSSLQQAIILAAMEGVAGENLDASKWVIDAMEVSKNEQKASNAETQQTAFQNMIEKRLTDDTAAANLYSTLFNADGSAKTDYLSDTLGLDADSLLNYDDFIKLSKSDQDIYLEKINKQFDAYIKSIWEQALGMSPSVESVPVDNEIVNYKELYDQWSVTTDDENFQLVGDEQFGYHVTGYQDARNAGYVLQNGKLYKDDGTEITTTLTEEQQKHYKNLVREEQYQTASLNYNNAVSQLRKEGIQGATDTQIDTFANSITVLEKNIEDLQNEADALNSIDIESAPKAGTAAYEALNKALQKTGKSMSDYVKMSAKDKTKVLGDAQISNLQAQQKQYDALISTYTNKYNDFATTDYATILASGDEAKISAYEAYLEAITQQQIIEQNIIDTQEQTAQNLISIGAANTDAAIALFQMEQEKLKTAADKLQEVAQILSENIETGFLTYEQQSKMSAEQLATWRSKTSQEERTQYAAELANQATQKQLDIQATANDNIALAQQFMSRRATTDSVRLDSAKNFKNSEAFKNLLDESNLEKGVRDALITADSAVRSTLGSDATVGDWGDAMRKELEQMGIDGKTTLSTLSAEGKDLMAEIWASAAKDAKEAAESAYENWVNAFQQIADARAKLLSGENLIEDIAGNPELLAQYAKNAGIDPKELSKMIMSGSVTADTFDLSKSKTEYIDAEKTKYGLDLVSARGHEFGTQNRYQDANAIGLKDVSSAKSQEVLKEYYQSILEASGLYGAQAESIATELAAGNGDYSKLTAARQHLISAIEGAAEAQEVQRQQTEDLNAATTASDNVIKNGVSDGVEEQYQGQSQERLTSVNEAIANLQEEKYREDGLGSISNLSTEDQTILGDFGINMNNVDSAAQNTANALAILAQAAYDAAVAQYDEGQVTPNADGTVTVTNSEGGEDVEASEKLTELRQNADAAKAAAQDVGSNTTGLQAGSIDMTAEEFESYTKALYENSDAVKEWTALTEEEKKAAQDFAVQAGRIDQAWDSLTKSQSDNIKTIKKGKKGNADYQKAINSLGNTIKTIFGDATEVTEDFVKEHIEDIEKMANGDEEAAERIEKALLEDMLGEDFNTEVNIDVNEDGVINSLDNLGTLLNNFGDEYADQPIGFEVTADESPVLQALNNVMAAAAAAGNDISTNVQSALDAIGWEPQLEYQVMNAEGKMVGKTTARIQVGDSFETASGTMTTMTEGMYLIPVIKGTKKTGGGASSTRKPSGGSGGGGGGGGNASTHDHREAPERYHENTKNYDRISEALEKVNKAKDRAFGKSYLKNLEKERELLNAQVNLLKQKEDEIQNYYDEDLKNLQTELNSLMGVLGGSNIALDIDPDTLNINNWEEIEAKITELYNQKADLTMSDEAWEKIEEQLSKYEEMRDQYEETVALLAENGLEIEDLLNQMSELALEEITYKVEYQVELNEHDLELLEYYQEIFEDDLSKASELMTNLTSQAGIAESNLAIIEGQIQELQTAYANGKINDADYYEGLSDLNSQMIDQLSELHDLQEQIAEHYTNTLELAEEEMGAHIDNLEHIADTMEKYREISELMGKGVDREWMKSTLATQIDVNKQKLTSQKAMLEELLKRKEEFEKNMNEDGTFSTELEQQQYEALIESLKEVHSNMLDYITEELEKMKELYETTIEDLFADFEEKMLGTGQSFADLADKYSYYQETQERHLSAAQELFEMSKLNRQIEQSIEDSTSKANKQILKDLQAQINARAELKDMTEYDIEMMNLQYQLALKQMALEDAQNAKSVVRLTRDNDGNYAYQYTADDEKVASAYQEYEDVLQQINDLASGRVGELEQAMVDAQQQYADAAKEIALDMTLTEEQRQAKLEELAKRYEETLLYIQEEYGYATGDLKNNLATVSSWYNTAIVEDSNTAKEQVADMIKNAQTWAQEYANLLTGEDGSVLSAWNNYAEAIASMSDFMDTVMTEEGLANYEQAAAAAGDAALQIVEQLSGELDGINATTEAWKKHNLEMENTIKHYQDLAAEMNAVMHLLGEHEAAETPPLGDASTGTSDDGTDVHFADPSTQANNVNQGTTTNVQTGATETATATPDDTTISGKQIIEWDGRLSDLEAEMLAAQQQYQTIISTFLDPELTAINRHDYFKEYEDTLKAWQSNGAVIEEILAQLELQEAQSYLNMAGMASAQTIIKDSVVNYNTITQHITLANDFPNVEHVQDIREAIEELILGASQYANSNMMSSPHKGGGGGGGGGKLHAISRS